MPHWKILSSVEIHRTKFFRMRTDECELPDGRVMPRYYVIEFPDWVNVVPVTTDGQMVMVEQYRHGADQTFLEVPGGMTNGPSEDPRDGGMRELREETGYGAAEVVACGFQYPNPAVQNNKLHTFLALGCEPCGKTELDPYEDLTVKLMPVKDVYALLDRGEITHSLIANSLTLARKHLVARGLL